MFSNDKYVYTRDHFKFKCTTKYTTMFLKKHSIHRISWLGFFIPTKVNLAEDGIFLHPVHATTCPLRVSSLRVPSEEGWDQLFHTWSRGELQASADLQHMPGDQRWKIKWLKHILILSNNIYSQEQLILFRRQTSINLFRLDKVVFNWVNSHGLHFIANYIRIFW